MIQVERLPEGVVSIAPIIIPGVTVRSPSLELLFALAHSNRGNETYGRYLNPTLTATEKTLERMFDVQRALVFGSGMAAISSTILTVLKPSARVIYSLECYRKTHEFFEFLRDKVGVAVFALTPDQLMGQNWMEFVGVDGDIVLFLETPSNPLLKLIDIEQLCKTLKESGLRERTTLIVDSTLATPSLFQPRKAGADIEIHSATKYLGGHDNLFSGVVMGEHDAVERIQNFRSILGGISSPEDLAKLAQQLETFPVRIAELSKSGVAVAKFLAAQAQIRTVYYPGLPTSPFFDLATKWTGASGVVRAGPDGSIPFGSVVSFDLANPNRAERFANAVGHLGVNFGGTHTILDPFGYRMAEEFRQQLGISTSLFRLSVGLDYSPSEVCNLLQRGFNAIKA